MFKHQEKLSDEDMSSISLQTEKCNKNYTVKDYPYWLRESLIKNLLIEQEYFQKKRDAQHCKMNKIQHQMSIIQKNRRKISSNKSVPKCTAMSSSPSQNLDNFKIPIIRSSSDREFNQASSTKSKRMHPIEVITLTDRPRITHSSKSKGQDPICATIGKSNRNNRRKLNIGRSLPESPSSKSITSNICFDKSASTSDSSSSRRNIHKSKSTEIEIERKLRKKPDSDNKKPRRKSGSENEKKSSKKPKERAKLNESATTTLTGREKSIGTNTTTTTTSTDIQVKNSNSKESIQLKNDDESIIVQIVEKREGLENIFANDDCSTTSKPVVEIGGDVSEEPRNELISEENLNYNVLIQNKEILEENFKNDSIDVNINIDFDDLMANGDIFTPPPTPQQHQQQQQIQHQLIDIDNSEQELINNDVNDWNMDDLVQRIFETEVNLMEIDESFFAATQLQL